MNLFERGSKDIQALPEEVRIDLSHHLAFRARIEKTEPDHLRYLCRHGWYIGHNGLFADKCKFCKMEDEANDS